MAGQFQVALVSPCLQASSNSSWPCCDRAMLHQPLNHPQTQSPTPQHCCPYAALITLPLCCLSPTSLLHLCCAGHLHTIMCFSLLGNSQSYTACTVLATHAYWCALLYLEQPPLPCSHYGPPTHSLHPALDTCLLAFLQAAWDMQFPAGFPRHFGWWKPTGSCKVVFA